MPTYEYQATEPDNGCAHCRERFEVDQAMSDDALKKCPQCGGPIQRMVSLCSMSTTQSTKSMLSDKNLKQKGFHKLVNEGDGKFRKTI